MNQIKGQEKFEGDIFHSSDLDGKDCKGKKVLVVGGGASAIEALEFATHGDADKTYILSRSEKVRRPNHRLFDSFQCP